MEEFRYFSLETDKKLFVDSETGETGISIAFVRRLDELRDRCGFPFHINSGYRSPRNSIEAAKPGGPGEHSRGAADISVHSGAQRYTIMMKAMAMGFTGIGVDDKFVHLDDRETIPVIWVY